MQPNKILFVDDEPRVLSALCRRLSTSFDVIPFERGAAALEYLQNNTDVDVIVADMRMPEMDGVELLQKVSEQHPGVKRIMLTGNSDQQTAMDAINKGRVYRFLRKPCDADDLRVAINEALEDQSFEEQDLDEIEERFTEQTGANSQDMFLSVVSDELRTPLSQVVSLSKSLSSQELVINERAKARLLRQMCEAGETALSRVDRILNFVKLQSLEKKSDWESSDLKALLSEIIAEMRPSANERGVSISTEIPDEDLKVFSSESLTRLALSESIENAIKYNAPDGYIAIQIKANEKRLGIRISNTGAKLDGILNSISTFKSKDNALNRNHSGLGLGLSLMHLASEKGGFRLDVAARKSGGAGVTLLFDRAV